MAFDENKTIIPLRIHDVAVSDDLHFYLSGLHWLDSNPVEQSFENLIQNTWHALNPDQEIDHDTKNAIGESFKRLTHSSIIVDHADHSPPQAPSSKKKLLVAACLAFILFAGAGYFLINNSGTADGAPPDYVTVYVSFNPEIRLDVNRYMSVERIEPMDSYGASIVYGFSLDLADAIRELTNRAIELGYLEVGGIVTAIVTPPFQADEEWIERTDHTLRSLGYYLDNNRDITLDVIRYLYNY